MVSVRFAVGALSLLIWVPVPHSALTAATAQTLRLRCFVRSGGTQNQQRYGTARRLNFLCKDGVYSGCIGRSMRDPWIKTAYRPVDPTKMTSSDESSEERQRGTLASSGRDYSSMLTAQSALERTAKQLEKLRQQQRHSSRRQPEGLAYKTMVAASTTATFSTIPDPLGEERERLYQQYRLLPASELKRQLKERQMSIHGRKPDLAHRLAHDDLIATYGLTENGKEYLHNDDDDATEFDHNNASSAKGLKDASTAPEMSNIVTSFAGVFPLSKAASVALTRAKFTTPSPIQAVAIPRIYGTSRQKPSSCILHAATGSGKTLAYLLPITEQLWREAPDSDSVALVLTPTRELAAQVAGVATVLAPPGTVRLVSRPMDLTARIKSQELMNIQQYTTGDLGPTTPISEEDFVNVQPRIFIGTAQAVQYSLYGDGKMPAPPTSKPEAMWILQNTAYLVLDEVDRLLDVVGGNSGKKRVKRKSEDGDSERTGLDVVETPAAILIAAATRLTLGKAIVVAASATVGRPLKRELARCMGLTPQECPPTLHDTDDMEEYVDTLDRIAGSDRKKGADTSGKSSASKKNDTLTTRAVTIPETVRHYYIPVRDGTSPGKILTTAFAAVQSLGSEGTTPRMLLVLTRKFGINIQNAIGALKHFRCQPEPISLSDALEANSAKGMMDVHRQVSGVSGIGASATLSTESLNIDEEDRRKEAKMGYLYVTGEENVRGLHLDGLDIVIVAGRPVGPDEYTHIAGRTGRAGQSGSVINIIDEPDANKLLAWEKMLSIQFQRCDSPKLLSTIVSDHN